MAVEIYIQVATITAISVHSFYILNVYITLHITHLYLLIFYQHHLIISLQSVLV